MHINDSKLNNNNNNNRKNNNINYQQHQSSNKLGKTTTSLSNKDRRDNDANSASVMSNLSSYSLIDDDHIDDQETINVGNLIIDLESDLEKEKIENEQANAKPNACTTSSAPLSSSSSSTSSNSSTFGARASSSTTISNNLPTQTSTPGGKSTLKSSNKHSNISINNAINNNNSNLINSSCSAGVGGSSPSNSTTSSTINNNSNNNNGHLMTTRTVFKSSADERGELKMRITRETKPGKSEHKIVTSPNQKSPTFNSSNNSSTSHVNNFEDISSNETPTKISQSSSISSTKECGTSTSIGTITEPDCLGPCEPGTSVTLEGIVWQETEGGILVVNVTWRGKTYVGALLDCTKHDWAPPRLCDSPASDIDSKAHKGVRTKRIVTRSNGIGLDEKNLLQTTGKLRNGKGRRILTSNDLASCNKRQRESDKSNENSAAQATEANTSTANVSSITNSETACVPMNIDTTSTPTNNESISTSNIATDKAGPNSPMLIGCSEPNCSKKYRNMNGLLYHQAHAHSSDNDLNNAQDNSSSVLKDKVSKVVSKDDQIEQKEEPSIELSDDRQSPPSNELKQDNQDIKILQGHTEKRRTPSPQISFKMSNKIPLESMSPSNNIAPLNHQEPPRASIIRNLDPERRGSTTNYAMSNLSDHNRRSPGTLRHLAPEQQGHHGFNNHSLSKPTSSSKQQSNQAPAPLPATTEEGMKPSGTSTGPPPAPHQANCYFNAAFMASNFNPYMTQYGFPRTMLPYDPIAPPSAQANAFLRFMNTMRPPSSPESQSRLLSPSVPKNLPFPHFKVDPAMPGIQNSPMANPTLPTMSPLANPPPLASGSPLLRMPSQGDPMMPPTSQPPFPPLPGMNPALGLPGPANPMGPLGPQMPSLVDDSLAKQFPRRFN